jgi:hypothetical protein
MLLEGRSAVIYGDIERSTMLGRAASLDDVGNVAVFVASDWARTVTATALNITCGTEVDRGRFKRCWLPPPATTPRGRHSGVWQTASTLLPSGSRTKPP